jgi:26S proteasome subunit RPN7
MPKLKSLTEKIAECEKNEGDEEVRDAMLARADYLCNIGNKEAAWEAYAAVEKKSPSPKHKIVIAFCKIRLEILLGNWTDVKALLDVAKDVCDKGGDWEKKNRLMARSAPLISLCCRVVCQVCSLRVACSMLCACSNALPSCTPKCC